MNWTFQSATAIYSSCRILRIGQSKCVKTRNWTFRLLSKATVCEKTCWTLWRCATSLFHYVTISANTRPVYLIPVPYILTSPTQLNISPNPTSSFPSTDVALLPNWLFYTPFRTSDDLLFCLLLLISLVFLLLWFIVFYLLLLQSIFLFLKLYRPRSQL